MSYKRTLTTSFALLALLSAAGMSQAADETGRITVTGEGSISAAPDMAIVNFGVLKTAPTARQALDDANKALADTIANLKSKGIEARSADVGLFGFTAVRLFRQDRDGAETDGLPGLQHAHDPRARYRRAGQGAG